MTGYTGASSPYDYGGSRLSPPAPGPHGKAAFEGYRKDILAGFEKDPPRYNPMNPERTQSSALVDLKDPIQVHLLTETALSDSKQYEILSQEEVDALKKQCQSLVQRIESTRSNLAIQSKYRDAAISMAKLYSPGKAEGRRRSLLPNRHSGDQSVREAQVEREASERKCEELAAELFSLEKRLMEPQQRLLEHTAGVLQLTHKASRRKNLPQQNGQLVNGIPGSPESLYTYSHSRDSLDPGADDHMFEDANFHPLDQWDGSRKNPIEIPMKSPIREQHQQLRGEVDRVREENNGLISSITAMERRLESLNGSLREAIVKFDPHGNFEYEHPPDAYSARQSKPGDILKSQMEYLETGLVAIQAEQDSFLGQSLKQNNGEAETVLVGLWDTIQSGLADVKRRKDERRKARMDKGLGPDEDESEDDGVDTTEAYSLDNFASRVRWLYRQATTLKDQKSVLKRQVKQQRELNNKSDADKDDELRRKQEELDQNRLIADRAEKDAMDAQRLLSEALQDLEDARQAGAANPELEARAAKAESLEAEARELRNLKSQLDAAEDKVGVLQSKLEQTEATLSTKDQTLKARDEESEKLNLTLAELKTEVTLARAELDGAYGSRAERAADVAALTVGGETGKLREELAGALKELEDVTKETIGAEREKLDLEGKLDDALTAKTSLEAEVQRAREAVHRLEEELDGHRLKAHPSAHGGGAGASMLSEQFRTTMREERKKFQEDIKEERAKNRRLEEELMRLKRAQGPGKSPLSPR